MEARIRSAGWFGVTTTRGFDLDEAALAIGMESMANVALRYLGESR